MFIQLKDKSSIFKNLQVAKCKTKRWAMSLRQADPYFSKRKSPLCYRGPKTLSETYHSDTSQPIQFWRWILQPLKGEKMRNRMSINSNVPWQICFLKQELGYRTGFSRQQPSASAAGRWDKINQHCILSRASGPDEERFPRANVSYTLGGVQPNWTQLVREELSLK